MGITLPTLGTVFLRGWVSTPPRELQLLLLGYLARPTPCQKNNPTWGFSHAVLSAKDVKILNTHNTLTRFALAVITTCVTRSIPVAVENPQASLFWKLPEVEDLVSEQAPVLHKLTTDFCGWGTPWRKSTGIYFWHWPSTVLTLGRRCHARREAKGAPACRG